MEMKMRFSIGTDDFKEIRTSQDSSGRSCFYCDKSLLIKEIIDDGAEVIVLPRPRRFGKTLNLSMLKYFFDIMEDNTVLFQGLRIAENKNIMKNWQGKFPVVFISFQAFRAQNIEEFKRELKNCITECYSFHRYLLTSREIAQFDKARMESHFSPDRVDVDFADSLYNLTKILKQYHGQEAIVLIDEYDRPLQEAYLNGFAQEVRMLFDNMLGQVLKGNTYLYKSVITSTTRIVDDSINNQYVCDITNNKYAAYFGFTEDEVKRVSDAAHLNELKAWYNGFTFGDNLTIYNPWSVLNALNRDYEFAPYWVDALDNDIVSGNLTSNKLADIEILLNGQSLEVDIDPCTVPARLKGNNSAFWNFAFMSGFLTLDADQKLRIPNKEIQYYFEKQLRLLSSQAEHCSRGDK